MGSKMEIQKGALLSECGRYRYSLSRDWSTDRKLGRVLWVMLNPSTADALSDDPTIRRCVAFARSWGCGGITVVNLFALRSPRPEALPGAEDRVGPDNDGHIARAVADHRRRQDLIVAAWGGWGSHRDLKGRRREVLRTLPVEETMCLRMTGTGDPGHPLYLRRRLGPVQYEFPRDVWE